MTFASVIPVNYLIIILSSTLLGASLPPLRAPVLPFREAYQRKLGYENHLIYDYLARSQARNWPYPASRHGRDLGVQQDTLRLALALRLQGLRRGHREPLFIP